MDRELFERIRQSGQAAVAVAERMPVLLGQLNPNSGDFNKLASNIQLGLEQSADFAKEAENAGSRLSKLARKVQWLWNELAEKLAERGRDAASLDGDESGDRFVGQEILRMKTDT